MSLRGLIFDVDGVLTDTVPLHYEAWKRMFSEFGYSFNPDIYRAKVDGKSRLDGVRGVMADATEDVITRAGEIKQGYYLEQLESVELSPFSDAARLVHHAASAGLRLAAASGSRNSPQVLRKIGLIDQMAAVVTGGDVPHGKPEPDIFLEAAARMSLEPTTCVVFEDAEAGVEAAKRGGFSCVGVDRDGGGQFLAGADMVVASLDEIDLDSLRRLVVAE
ncbi:MAG: HAD family hydrolase [Acidimicrobiia bacterium]